MEALLESTSLSLLGFSTVFLAAFVGALVQGSVGFGLNLIVVPAIAAFAPAALPAASIILAFPMTLGSALRERSEIDYSAILWATLGRLPGVFAGAWIVMVVDGATLGLLIGAIVVFAVLMSLTSVRIPVNRVTQAIAGLLGGLMGTTSSIGGPPMAVLYQHESGPRMRSTLGATFLVGTVLSLGALAFVGEVSAFHWRFGLAMVPAVLLGLVVSRAFHGWLDRGWLRPCVLGFSGLSGLAVVLRGLL